MIKHKIKKPRKDGRPIGKKWDKAKLLLMRYCPEALGGDYRAIWTIVGHKWVYCSTKQLCKSGGNAKATLSRQAWDKLVSSKGNGDIKVLA
tara:strand:- start:69 stop:341 length:273 start_codon:yes stop_codon:yes gene_type:complete